jgi:hypothetical protein
MLKACKTHAFFYFDIQGASALLDLYPNLLTLIERYINQPVGKKCLMLLAKEESKRRPLIYSRLI